jgi:hypothetical protein
MIGNIAQMQYCTLQGAQAPCAPPPPQTHISQMSVGRRGLLSPTLLSKKAVLYFNIVNGTVEIFNKANIFWEEIAVISGFSAGSFPLL